MRFDMTERDRFMPEVDLGDVLRNMQQKLFRRWHLIAVFVFIAAALAVIYVARATPQYTANASILIDPRTGLNPGQNEGLAPGLLTSDGLTVDSELRILGSREVTARVVSALGLEEVEEDSEESSGLGLMDLARGLMAGLRGSEADADPEGLSDELVRQRELEVLRTEFVRGLEIRRSGDSYIIDISYTSPDLEFAPLAVNTLITEYLELSREQNIAGVERNQQWLAGRIEELGKDVEEAENAVSVFRQENNLLSPEGSLLPIEVALNAAIDEQVRLSTQALALDVQIEQLGEQIAAGQLDAVQVQPEDRTKALEEFEAIYVELLQQERIVLLNRDEESAAAINLRNRIEQQETLILEEYGQVKERLEARSASLHRQIAATETLIEGLSADYGDDSQKTVELRGLEREANAKRELYERLLEQYNSASQLVSFDATSARVIAWAVPPDSKSAPRSKQIVAIAIFSGLVLAVGLIVVLEAWDNSYRNKQDISQELGLDFLGISPRFGSDRSFRRNALSTKWKALRSRGGALSQMDRSAMWFDFAASHPTSIFAQTMRAIHFNLTMLRRKASQTRQGMVVGVTSSVKNEGKTSTALNLATYLASQGERTVFVDLDVMSSEATHLLNPAVPETNSLSMLLQNAEQTAARLEPVPDTPSLTLIGNFDQISSLGPQHSDALAEALAHLQTKYDYVVADLPPFHGVAETTFLSGLCSSLVFVVKWGGTQRPEVKSALRKAGDAKSKILGIVFTQVRLKAYDATSRHESYYL